ncbi:MAG: hypothetical protein AB7P76_06990 [Candidatus Melainabacteria bacterium]
MSAVHFGRRPAPRPMAQPATCMYAQPLPAAGPGFAPGYGPAMGVMPPVREVRGARHKTIGDRIRGFFFKTALLLGGILAFKNRARITPLLQGKLNEVKAAAEQAAVAAKQSV